MAGEYGVNINLRVKGQSGLDRLKAKVNELTASVDKIRGIDIMNPRNTGGAFGKKEREKIKKYRQDMNDIVKSVNNAKGAFGKTAKQQIAASEALDLYANSIELGTDAHKDALNAALKQAKAIGRESDAINRNTKARNDNNKSKSQGNKLNDRSTGSALKSGLVSGAFPLLFGQGPLGGLTGFAGGFVGTKMGGQMGGFAGGLVATALLQQLTTLKSALDELGGSFDEINPNIDKLTESLGLAGTAEGERLKMIERTQGAHVALALATEKMTDIVGQDGVKSLKEFAETSQLLGNSFKKTMLKIQVAMANLLNSLSKFIPGSGAAKSNETDRLAQLGGAAEDPFLKALISEQKKIEQELKIIEKQDLNKTIKNQALGPLRFSSGGLFPSQIKQTAENQVNEQKNKVDLKLNLKRLNDEINLRKENFAQIGKGVELDKRRQMILDEGLKSITDQNNFLQNQIDLGKQGAEIEKLKAEMANKMKIAVEDLKPLQVTQIEDAVKLKDQLQQQLEITEAIGQTLKDNFTDAIMGATSFKDAMINVLNTIKRKLIETQIDKLFDSARSKGGGGIGNLLGGVLGGLFGRNKPVNDIQNKILSAADGGRIPGGRASLVGERGPELFTPGVSGMITPNHALGGSTTNIVNVSVNASGSSVQGDQQEGRALGQLIASVVQTTIVQEQRPGGLLNR